MLRLEDAMKCTMGQVQAGQKGADAMSILSLHSAASIKTPQTWCLIIRDLEDLGISPDDAQNHRAFIVQWFTEALQNAEAVQLVASGNIPESSRDVEVFEGIPTPTLREAVPTSSQAPGGGLPAPRVGLALPIATEHTTSDLAIKPRQTEPSRFWLFNHKANFARIHPVNAPYKTTYTGDGMFKYLQTINPEKIFSEANKDPAYYSQDYGENSHEVASIPFVYSGPGKRPTPFRGPINSGVQWSDQPAKAEDLVASVRPMSMSMPVIRDAPAKSQRMVEQNPQASPSRAVLEIDHHDESHGVLELSQSRLGPAIKDLFGDEEDSDDSSTVSKSFASVAVRSLRKRELSPRT